jgi:hypothetical protein
MMNKPDKLAYLSLESLSSLVQCLWVRPGAYTRVEYLKGASLGSAPALPANIILVWKRYTMDKHNSLLQKKIKNYNKKVC